MSVWVKGVWGTCVLRPCKHHAILRKRGARDLIPTSPEPCHGDGTGMDWSTGIPFVRQQASGAFYLCFVLSIPT